MVKEAVPVASYNPLRKKKDRAKKWSCEFCNRRFAERGTLTNHRRTHTKETPFGCETCGRRFSHRATLLNHRKTHNTFRKYGCQHCGKRFHRKSNMNRHIQVVHMGKPNPRKRRDVKPMQFRMRSSVPPPMFASDSSSDASPIQGPADVAMPPPPLAVDLMLQQMGFPQNLTQGHIAAMSPTYTGQGGMPERVTLSVTYEQNQLRRSSLTVPPPVSFQMPPLPNLSVARTRGPISTCMPGVPPPLTFEPKMENTIKEEPIDNYTVPAAPPSLEHSRSNSPIIIGSDDYMMKPEVHTPSPMMMHGSEKLFSFGPKSSEVTGRMPTPLAQAINAGAFAFPGSNGIKQELPAGFMGHGIPMGHEVKPAVQKKDSIPDKLKLKLDSLPMSAYLASQMMLTIQKPDGGTSNIALHAPSPRTTVLME